MPPTAASASRRCCNDCIGWRAQNLPVRFCRRSPATARARFQAPQRPAANRPAAATSRPVGVAVQPREPATELKFPRGSSPPRRAKQQPGASATNSRLAKTPSVMISAAALGVAARMSATKSAMVKSISCPTADTTGSADSKIARATASSLNAHKSSSDPPPRVTKIRSKFRGC